MLIFWKFRPARNFKRKGEAMNEELKKLMIHIYNSGYHAGHHDTVEGGYSNIFPCDMETYHEEVVSELIEELEVKP